MPSSLSLSALLSTSQIAPAILGFALGCLSSITVAKFAERKRQLENEKLQTQDKAEAASLMHEKESQIVQKQEEEPPKETVAAVAVAPKNEEQEDTEDDSDEYITEDEDDEDDDEEENPLVKQKLVLVVRMDLKMNTGKMCAQCSHATLGAYREILRRIKKKPRDPSSKEHKEWLDNWFRLGCAKITLKAKDLAELNDLKKRAKEDGLPVHYVIDAGKTQVPENSVTVLAIGPAPQARVDKITGKLKLL